MTWPTDQDYNEAIQDPRICFEDFELQSGTPDLSRLGLPKAISGNYAAVYKVKSNGRTFAVRCFSKSVAADQENRYSLISSYLNQHKLPYMVDFSYLSKGIRIRGQWYPIVKMEWLDGMQLNSYLQKNLNNPAILQELSRKFIKLVEDLKIQSIAHGDLQHGNILIVNDNIRLIDYDGMFVPGMEGIGSHELGNRHFQHPKRDALSFGSYIDTFSTWVIYLSILALSIDPGLWQLLQAGVDNLLFKKEDFDDMYNSQAFNILEGINNFQVKALLTNFRNLVYASDLISLGTLPDSIKSLGSLSSQSNQNPSSINTNSSSGSSWLSGYVGATQATSQLFHSNTNQAFSGNASGASWLLDFIEQPKKTLEPQLKHEWWVVFIVGLTFSIPLIITLLGFINIFFGLGISLPQLFFVWAYYLHDYNNLPLHKEKENLIEQISVLNNKVHEFDTKLAAFNKNKNSLSAEETKKINDLIHTRSLDKAENSEILQLDRNLSGDLARNSAQRSSLTTQENAEINQLQQSLKTNFDSQIRAKLAYHFISNAKISGIGANMAAKLSAYGINTAADIVDVRISHPSGRYSNEVCNIVTRNGEYHVDGIGPQKGYALLHWKNTLEASIRQNTRMPSSQTQEAAIRQKFQSQRQYLYQSDQALQQGAVSKKAAIKGKYIGERNKLNIEIGNLKSSYEKQRQAIDINIRDENTGKSKTQWNMSKLDHELKSYDGITFKAYLKQTYLSPLVPLLSFVLK